MLFFGLFTGGRADDSWIQETIDFTINTDFENALGVVRKEIDRNPDDYRAWFYRAATFNSKMTHFENEAGLKDFDEAIDKTIEIIDTIFESETVLTDSIRAQLLFYIGSAYGYRAYLQGRQGHFIPAVTNGLKSVSYLKESLENDSTLYGAYLGIGAYKYWRYSRLNFISWLPFVPDDREEGIAMIKIAIAQDSLSKYMAMHQLIYILLDYDRFDEAIVLANAVVEKYPYSQFMWWANAHAFFKKGDYLKAEASYNQLYQLIRQDTNRNMTHLLKCQYKLAFIAKQLNKLNLCSEYCEKIIGYSDSGKLSDTAQDIVSDTLELWKECQESLSQNL